MLGETMALPQNKSKSNHDEQGLVQNRRQRQGGMKPRFMMALSIKKLLRAAMLFFPLCLLGSAIAAPVHTSDLGDAHFAPRPQQISTVKGIYLEAALGGVRTYYPNVFTGLSDWHNGNWQLMAGTDLGYRLDSFVGAEVGFDYFLSPTANNAAGQKLTFNQLAFYAAAKLMVPVYTGLDAFAKFGFSNARMKVKGGSLLGSLNTSVSHWGPVFAVGAQYAFNQNYSVNATYTRFSGVTNPSSNDLLPAFNVVSVGFGVRFQV